MTEDDARSTDLDVMRLRFQIIGDSVRQLLLDVLHVDGPQTIASLRRKVPSSKGSVRWDMQRLAEVGLVTSSGAGAAAVWRAVPGAVGFTEEMASHPTMAVVIKEFDRVLNERRIARLRTWAVERHTRSWTAPWKAASISTDSLVRAIPSELDALDEDVAQCIAAFRAASEARRAGEQEPNPDEEAVFVTVGAFPFKLGRA